MPIFSALFRKVTWKALVAAAGLTAGVVAIILAQRELEEERVTAPSRAPRPKTPPQPAARKPAEKIQIEAEEESEAPPVVASLALSLKARPATFKRRKPGAIVAQTTPGAACTLDAKYSTNRRPSGLESGPIIASGDGLVEWTWDIGTSGDYVDVTVKASMPGMEVLEKSKRVKITD